MNISEMHVWFRQYAQQMGMQNVRAILPEQIDLLINTSISDTINQIIRENIGITNDRIVTDNSKIGQINALRTLYKVKTLNICTHNSDTGIFQVESGEEHIGRLYTRYADHVNVIPNYRFLVDFAISYAKSENGAELMDEGYIRATDPLTGAKTTKWFPVRIIDDAYLADTLQDFVLSPRLRTPIITVYGDTNNSTALDVQFDLYIGDGIKTTYITQGGSQADAIEYPEKLVPYRLRMSYIASPNKVKYASDLTGENVDCDLPEQLHVDILKHAVDLYRISISGALSQAQQQEQQAQQEASRNNYRPANEGYQNNG